MTTMKNTIFEEINEKNNFTSSVWRWESGSGSVNFGGTVSLLKNVESVNGSFPVAEINLSLEDSYSV